MSLPQAAAPQYSLPAQPMSNDTALAWNEANYYWAGEQYSMEGLYADFRDTFDGWTQERFQKVDPAVLRLLKRGLRRGGVNTGHVRKQTARALADLAQLPCVEEGVWPRPPCWDTTEFMAMIFRPNSEAYNLQNTWKSTPQILTQSQQAQQPQTARLPAPSALQPAQQPARGPTQTQPVGGLPIQAAPSQQSLQAPTQTPHVRGQPPQSMSSQPARLIDIPHYRLLFPTQQRRGQTPQQRHEALERERALWMPRQFHNNQDQRPASQPMTPSSQQVQQRPAMVSSTSAQQPKPRQGSGQEIAQSDADDHDSDETEYDSNGDRIEDEDDYDESDDD